MDLESVVFIIGATIGLIIGVLVNIYFIPLTREIYLFNLVKKLKKNELDDDFYKTLYLLLKKSDYDVKEKNYTINRKMIADIIYAIEKLTDEADTNNIILNNRLDYLVKTKILTKKDTNEFIISRDFNDVVKLIQSGYRGGN
ncbi:MAG: hypothetical protein NTW30_04715 [Candidatus Aenigmarchaeota archaeon]|nr:hypothetical protein [Candidatus Aenigmarchaeota archaeon]